MGFRIASVAAALLAGGVLALVGLHITAPQTSGLIALTQVVEPHLVLVALIVSPLALGESRRWMLGVVVALLIVGGLRYGPGLISLPTAGASADTLRVVTWNLMAGSSGAASLHDGLSDFDLDLVGLVELQSQTSDAIESDPELIARFPHRLLLPHRSVQGMGLLSRHPLTEYESWSDPPLIRAVVQPEGRAPMSVFVGHPRPASIQTLVGVPIGLDTTLRDEQIRMIRSRVDEDLAAGRSVLLIGDFNVTSHEPAYAVLAAGLRDAHLEAGLGPGFTWRPARLAGIPIGLLRIDYILSSLDVAISSTEVDCVEQSDHCRLSARVWRQLDAE